MAYTFTKYSAGGGASEEEVVQIVKTNFEGGFGYEEGSDTEIVSEQTIAVPNRGYAFQSFLPLTEGNAYTVNFDGTLYECVATTLGSVVYLGNAAIAGGTPDTSEPFIVMNMISDGVSVLLASVGEHIFSLSGYVGVTHQIDPKYINTIGKNGTGMDAEVFNGVAAENASGICSHAEGYNTIASGDYSHAEGHESTASGLSSHAEGLRATANNMGAHAEGNGTHATGKGSHAEGEATTASGDYSHAEGLATTASGIYSHAEGHDTIASGAYSHVQGRSNIEDTDNKYAHIVGNGNFDTHSNAHTLDWDGNAWFAGTVEGTALILKSPSGKRFKITVNDSGTISATEVTT